MPIKIPFSELVEGSCFKQGKRTRKKGDGKTAISVSPKGRVTTRKVKGDPQVEIVGCPLRLFGAGLRLHPEVVVEIGDGNIMKSMKRRK